MRAINPVQSLSMATNRRLVVPQCIHVSLFTVMIHVILIRSVISISCDPLHESVDVLGVSPPQNTYRILIVHVRALFVCFSNVAMH